MPKLSYPWLDWFKEDMFILKLGTDYFTTQESMANQIRNAASKRGFKVSVRGSSSNNFLTVIIRERPIEENAKSVEVFNEDGSIHRVKSR
jgi:hypothetical protein